MSYIKDLENTFTENKQKKWLHERFQKMLISKKWNTRYYGFLFFYLGIFRDLLSGICTILVIFNQYHWTIYYISMILSAIVTGIGTVCLTLRVDKRYYLNRSKYLRLSKEGWFFYTKSGVYKDNCTFEIFVERVENILDSEKKIKN